nr:serine hydrolase [Oceanococcus sp. HetDA_MAG_MS8]
MKWCALLLGVWAGFVSAYPLDGYERTGIRRLDFYARGHSGEIANVRRQHPGALLPLDQVQIPPAGTFAHSFPQAMDTSLRDEIRSALGVHADSYALHLVDLSDAKQIEVVDWHAERLGNVGSVGKLLVALAVLHQLQQWWPEPEQRLEILRNTQVVASSIATPDHHKVPIWQPTEQELQYRPLQPGDQASLFEYLDWMISASSNAAASVLMQQVILLAHMQRDYAASSARRERVWAELNKVQRGEVLAEAMDRAVVAAGLDPEQLRQGSLLTRQGKAQVASRQSYASPLALNQMLYRMLQGKLLDRFSSHEMLRLMYQTQRRIRYASHPVLTDSAVYFKSGSLYSCKPEEGFSCGPYRGNRINLLTSTILVQYPADEPQVQYLVSVRSNVLRVNSAVAHQRLAGAIHRLMLQKHGVVQGAE